ncbi:hypothetical protein BESB_079490 [Besnoitia besnoiti]|uniref:Uncharacterized protein n=1 Tax=Besnoitia besnoiti TaxID=94643 RepID=A0A2A9MDH1_BESBE|nr:hypothetical protein BESB_079490 [Besnoitia besnoiti]PFH33733.1 hypothetical protein BESB_079490 [Besnoitia besnoiti]
MGSTSAGGGGDGGGGRGGASRRSSPLPAESRRLSPVRISFASAEESSPPWGPPLRRGGHHGPAASGSSRGAGAGPVLRSALRTSFRLSRDIEASRCGFSCGSTPASLDSGTPEDDLRQETRRQAAALRGLRKSAQDIVGDMEKIQLEADVRAKKQLDVDIEHALLASIEKSTRQWHRQAQRLFCHLVPPDWAIDDSDPLVKRMRRKPEKEVYQWDSDVESEAEQEYWRGPSPEDIFGDNLIVKPKTPYKLLGVYTRRMWAASVPAPFIRLHEREKCLQQQADAQAPRLGVSQQSDDSQRSTGKDVATCRRVSERATPRRRRAKLVPSAPENAGIRHAHLVTKGPDYEAMVTGATVGHCAYSCSGCEPTPCPFPLAALKSEPPPGYARAPVAEENARIPSVLEDFLYLAHVPIKRPPWDARKSPLLSTQEVKKAASKPENGAEKEDDVSQRARRRGHTIYSTESRAWTYGLFRDTHRFTGLGRTLGSWFGLPLEDAEENGEGGEDRPVFRDLPTEVDFPFSPFHVSSTFSMSPLLDVRQMTRAHEGGPAKTRAEPSASFERAPVEERPTQGPEEAEERPEGPTGDADAGEAEKAPEKATTDEPSWVSRKVKEVCQRFSVPDVQTICQISQKLKEGVAAAKHETENRIFDQKDVRIFEYWQLQRDRDGPAWVYQGLQWDLPEHYRREVPMQGSPLTEAEIAAQQAAQKEVPVDKRTLLHLKRRGQPRAKKKFSSLFVKQHLLRADSDVSARSIASKALPQKRVRFSSLFPGLRTAFFLSTACGETRPAPDHASGRVSPSSDGRQRVVNGALRSESGNLANPAEEVAEVRQI